MQILEEIGVTIPLPELPSTTFSNPMFPSCFFVFVTTTSQRSIQIADDMTKLTETVGRVEGSMDRVERGMDRVEGGGVKVEGEGRPELRKASAG